jgi:hypothetical protein
VHPVAPVNTLVLAADPADPDSEGVGWVFFAEVRS